MSPWQCSEMQHFLVIQYHNKTWLFLFRCSCCLAGLQHPCQRIFIIELVIETTFLTNCFGEASITSVLFLSHLKDTAHTIGKGRDSLYFHFSFSSCSPAFLVRPSTIKEEGDFFFDLTSVQLARVPLAPLYPMEYSTHAPPFLPNVEAQKTL